MTRTGNEPTERRPRWGPMLAGFALFGPVNLIIFLFVYGGVFEILLESPTAKRSLPAALVLLAVTLVVATGAVVIGERWFAAGWLGGYALLAIASSGSCAFVPVPVDPNAFTEDVPREAASALYVWITLGGALALLVATIWSARRQRRDRLQRRA